MRKRTKPGVTRKVVLDADVDSELQQALEDSRETLSAFVQAAITRRLSDWEAPLDFIYARRTRRETRQKAKQKWAGVADASALNLKLDRPDGIPIARQDCASPKMWAEDYTRMTKNQVLEFINGWRRDLGRDDLTESEWLSIVKHMGAEPGSGRGKVTNHAWEGNDGKC